MKKRGIGQKFFCVLLAAAIMLAGLARGGGTRVEAETSTTTLLPISCYALTKKPATYSDKLCRKKTGEINASESCKILETYEDGVVKVKQSGQTSYARMSDFFKGLNFMEIFAVWGGGGDSLLLWEPVHVWQKPSGKKAMDALYPGVLFVIVGHSHKRTQVIYPSGGGYKMGWIDGTYTTPAKGFTIVCSAQVGE